jgi:hypothetical protein
MITTTSVNVCKDVGHIVLCIESSLNVHIFYTSHTKGVLRMGTDASNRDNDAAQTLVSLHTPSYARHGHPYLQGKCKCRVHLQSPETISQSRNFLFSFSPNSVTRMDGRAWVSRSLRRSSKVLLMSIRPPVPTIMAPPALRYVSQNYSYLLDATYESSGSGSLSSMVMATSWLMFFLYSVWASSMAFLVRS